MLYNKKSVLLLITLGLTGCFKKKKQEKYDVKNLTSIKEEVTQQEIETLAILFHKQPKQYEILYKLHNNTSESTLRTLEQNTKNPEVKSLIEFMQLLDSNTIETQKKLTLPQILNDLMNEDKNKQQEAPQTTTETLLNNENISKDHQKEKNINQDHKLSNTNEETQKNINQDIPQENLEDDTNQEEEEKGFEEQTEEELITHNNQTNNEEAII